MIESELSKIKTLYEAVNKILQFTKDISGVKELESNLLVWDAVKMNLVVIDEMDSKIDINTKEQFKNINWNKIKEIRPYILFAVPFKLRLPEPFVSVSSSSTSNFNFMSPEPSVFIYNFSVSIFPSPFNCIAPST